MSSKCEQPQLLIVDDELEIGGLIQAIIKEAGYSSQFCRRPDEAKIIFGRNPFNFCGAFLDYNYENVGVPVEEMNGIVLAANLQQIAERARIFKFPITLLSGTEFTPGQLQELKVMGVPRLRKPVDLDELEMAVTRMARAGLEVLV